MREKCQATSKCSPRGFCTNALYVFLFTTEVTSDGMKSLILNGKEIIRDKGKKEIINKAQSSQT